MGNTDRPARVPLARVLVVLVLGAAGPSMAAPPVPEVVPLKRSRLRDPSIVPLALRLPVEGRLPAVLAPGTFAAREERGVLVVDAAGRGGRGGSRVSPKRSAVLEVGADRSSRNPVLVWRAPEGWRAAPARLGRAEVARRTFLEVLEVPGPGGGGAGEEWMRYAGGAFRPLLPSSRIQVVKGWLAPRLERGPKGDFVLRPGFNPAALSLDDVRWRGLLAVNDFRNAVGLEPLSLDEGRSRGCRAHAEYIRLNSGDGMGHEEIPGRPGYSEAGVEAGREGVMDATGHPRVALAHLTAMVLHRPPFLHTPDQPLGVGVVASSGSIHSNGPPGLTVFWAGKACTSPTFPILVPAPGARDVPRQARPERPAPDLDPLFYDRPRGYPVSVSFLPEGAKDVRLALEFLDRRPHLMAGFCFTPEHPVHHEHAHNHRTAFFVAEDPLPEDARLRAIFEARVGEETVRFSWVFTTGS